MASSSFGMIAVCSGYVIWGFRCEAAENCIILRCYSPSDGNLLSSFRDKLSVPFAGSKEPHRKSLAQILHIGLQAEECGRCKVSVVWCQLLLAA